MDNLTLISKISPWMYFSEIFMGVEVPVDRGKRIRGGFYRGSRFLVPLADFMHVPLDQINFVICGFISLALGQLMRRKFCPSRISPHTRAFIEMTFGLAILSFCFGNQIRVLVLQSSVAYLMMICLPPNQFMAILVTLWSLFYMALVHLCRLHYDYGGYTLDISGPVMVQTQRLSSLAFNLVDGAIVKKNREKKALLLESATHLCSNPTNDVHVPNSDEQSHGFPYFPYSNYFAEIKSNLVGRLRTQTDYYRNRIYYPTFNKQKQLDSLQLKPIPISHLRHAVEEMPGPVEFFAYTLYFHGVCVGPFLFFTEYMDYLRGYGLKQLPPINLRYSVVLLLRLVASGLSAAYLLPLYPFEFVLEDGFKLYPLYKRILYCTISLFLVRQRYYFAWMLAELNGVAIGIGYTGKCPRTGRTLNQNTRNFDFMQVEFGVSLKPVVDAWNISTTRWLREVFYDRLPTSCRTILVFLISAFWHGFYPGYYIMFLSFALFTAASRVWHKQYRTYFRKSSLSIYLYNLFTTIVTNLLINYGQAPFHLLDLWASIHFLSLFYYIPHIVSFGILFIQPIILRYVTRDRQKHQKQLHGRGVGG